MAALIYAHFLHQYNWPPRYNWSTSIVERGVKYHNPRYKFLVLGRDESYFIKIKPASTKTFSETIIIKMLDIFY